MLVYIITRRVDACAANCNVVSWTKDLKDIG